MSLHFLTLLERERFKLRCLLFVIRGCGSSVVSGLLLRAGGFVALDCPGPSDAFLGHSIHSNGGFRLGYF